MYNFIVRLVCMCSVCFLLTHYRCFLNDFMICVTCFYFFFVRSSCFILLLAFPHLQIICLYNCSVLEFCDRTPICGGCKCSFYVFLSPEFISPFTDFRVGTLLKLESNEQLSATNAHEKSQQKVTKKN